MEKEKTIYDLGLHETLFVEEKLPLKVSQSNNDIKKYEVTRVPGGWVYAFEYPGWRQSQTVFIPFDNGFQPNKK